MKVRKRERLKNDVNGKAKAVKLTVC